MCFHLVLYIYFRYVALCCHLNIPPISYALNNIMKICYGLHMTKFSHDPVILILLNVIVSSHKFLWNNLCHCFHLHMPSFPILRISCRTPLDQHLSASDSQVRTRVLFIYKIILLSNILSNKKKNRFYSYYLNGILDNWISCVYTNGIIRLYERYNGYIRTVVCKQTVGRTKSIRWILLYIAENELCNPRATTTTID